MRVRERRDEIIEHAMYELGRYHIGQSAGGHGGGMQGERARRAGQTRATQPVDSPFQSPPKFKALPLWAFPRRLRRAGPLTAGGLSASHPAPDPGTRAAVRGRGPRPRPALPLPSSCLQRRRRACVRCNNSTEATKGVHQAFGSYVSATMATLSSPIRWLSEHYLYQTLNL
ncbi:hypothetical protein PYCCODRAFT_373400 [Trametes coccinea BRFM310]|uniref:Uncharacterized protein n=1 Tax=Trametes coccinea (strain BRFM310) TaxID=1353009 RepID=A0A1Y2J3L8_TRAC3|nr:hypothetical protein PYCCODRAFT_373400 [Trametes coccinea BRFM310]